jgi:hypothetical protein
VFFAARRKQKAINGVRVVDELLNKVATGRNMAGSPALNSGWKTQQGQSPQASTFKSGFNNLPF